MDERRWLRGLAPGPVDGFAGERRLKFSDGSVDSVTDERLSTRCKEGTKTLGRFFPRGKNRSG